MSEMRIGRCVVDRFADVDVVVVWPPDGGTIFHRTRKPLKTWFAVIWLACPKSLQQMFGFGSYGAAWTWMHKIRRAMVRSASALPDTLPPRTLLVDPLHEERV